MMRRQVNRVLVAVTLIAVLPTVTLSEWLRPGLGRRVGVSSARVLARACGVRFDVRGAERVPSGPCVVVANHRSPLDILALLMVQPELRFMAAAELFRIPLLGSAMRALDTASIDRRNSSVARRQVEALVARRLDWPVVVFAEGGIGQDGTLRRFRSGAFVLAISGGVPIVPVALTGTATALPPRAMLGVRPAAITVEVLPPITTAGLGIGDRKRLRDETRDALASALAAA